MPIINQIVKGSGGSAPELYPLLSRVVDDSNNEIGTVGCYFTGAGNQKYAVVVLDAQYRTTGGQWLSTNANIADLTYQNNQTSLESTDTATYNCDKILAYCAAQGLTSSGVSHCRSQTFTINGQTYNGQLANQIETLLIFMHRAAINTSDPTVRDYPSLALPSNTNMWTSSQFSASQGARFNLYGVMDATNKTSSLFIMPVLEIPIS